MRVGFALIAAAALCAPASAQTTDSKEPNEVLGRSLADWIKDITHKDPSKREMAVRAVLGFGPERAYEAVPAMLTELRRHTPEVPIDTSVRVNLAISLGQILGAKQNDSKLKEADPKIIKEAVTLLTRLLRDSQGIVKYQAAKALASIGPPESRACIQDLIPLLKDKTNYELRQAGALCLAQIVVDPKNPAHPFVHTNLQALLTDTAGGVRQAACQALNLIGHPVDAKQKAAILAALDPLVKKDPEPGVQIWATVTTMSYAGKVDAAHLESIAQRLHKGDVNTRMQAAQALGTVGNRAKEIVPAMIEALQDPDPNVVGFTILALGRIESVRAVPALQKLAAETKNEALKKAALDTVQQIQRAVGAAR